MVADAHSTSTNSHTYDLAEKKPNDKNDNEKA